MRPELPPLAAGDALLVLRGCRERQVRRGAIVHVVKVYVPWEDDPTVRVVLALSEKITHAAFYAPSVKRLAYAELRLDDGDPRNEIKLRRCT